MITRNLHRFTWRGDVQALNRKWTAFSASREEIWSRLMQAVSYNQYKTFFIGCANGVKDTVRLDADKVNVSPQQWQQFLLPFAKEVSKGIDADKPKLLASDFTNHSLGFNPQRRFRHLRHQLRTELELELFPSQKGISADAYVPVENRRFKKGHDPVCWHKGGGTYLNDGTPVFQERLPCNDVTCARHASRVTRHAHAHAHAHAHCTITKPTLAPLLAHCSFLSWCCS